MMNQTKEPSKSQEYGLALLFGLVGIGVVTLAFTSVPVDAILLGFGLLLMYLGVVLTNAAITAASFKILKADVDKQKGN